MRNLLPLSSSLLLLVVLLASPLRRGGGCCSALAVPTTPPTSKSPPLKVLVTGASGRTGRLVFERLLDDDRYDPLALVRSEKSGKKLRRAVKQTGLNQVVVCDVTTLAVSTDPPPHAMEGCESMIICTSAVPTVSKLCLVGTFLKIPWRLIRRKTMIDFKSLKFVWKNGQYPEQVDYLGQIAQIDLARKLGIRQVIIVGSMGGTDPSNFLNEVGKNPDGTGYGDILLWKRRAERYLVDQAETEELDYAILHPGGLVDTPGGQQEFVLDVDDRLKANKQRTMIGRADVADLCVAALSVPRGTKAAFDCITRKRETTTSDDGASTSKVRTADEALAAFLQEGKTYNYAL